MQVSHKVVKEALRICKHGKKHDFTPPTLNMPTSRTYHVQKPELRPKTKSHFTRERRLETRCHPRLFGEASCGVKRALRPLTPMRPAMCQQRQMADLAAPAAQHHQECGGMRPGSRALLDEPWGWRGILSANEDMHVDEAVWCSSDSVCCNLERWPAPPHDVHSSAASNDERGTVRKTARRDQRMPHAGGGGEQVGRRKEWNENPLFSGKTAGHLAAN